MSERESLNLQTMKKKIVIFTYSIGGAGAEKVAANLFNNLSKDKYDIQLVLMNTMIEYNISTEQKIHFIEKSDMSESGLKKFIKLPVLAMKFAKYCNENEIDLVLSLMSRPNIIAGLSKIFGIKAKVLISERCYTPCIYSTKTFIGKIKAAVLKFAYRRADAILPNSKGTAIALQSHFSIQSEYSVVKNPTDINAINTLKLLPVAKNWDVNKFTFINVAAFREEKNHRLLISAVEEIRNLDFQLLLIGKGIELEPIKAMVKKSELDHKVFFINFTDNPYRYMHRADCFLLSSSSEGFPNVLIESMVCGLPIISVDCKTGPRELLAPNSSLNTVIKNSDFEIAEFGILTAPLSKTAMANAMKWAIQNPGALQNYKEKIVVKANDYEMGSVLNEFSEIFDLYAKP